MISQTQSYLCDLLIAEGKHEKAAELLQQLVANPANFTTQVSRLRLMTELASEWQLLHQPGKALLYANAALADLDNPINDTIKGLSARLTLAELFCSLREYKKSKLVCDDASSLSSRIFSSSDWAQSYLFERLKKIKTELTLQSNRGK